MECLHKHKYSSEIEYWPAVYKSQLMYWSLSFCCLLLRQSLLPKDPMVLNVVPILNGKGARIIGVGSSFLELTYLCTKKRQVYVGDYCRKITEPGPSHAATSLLRALRWLWFIHDASHSPRGGLQALPSGLHVLRSHLLGLIHAAVATHVRPCCHWETQAHYHLKAFGLLLSALHPMSSGIFMSHVLVFLMSFLPNILFLGRSLMISLSKIEPSFPQVLHPPSLLRFFLQVLGLKTYSILLMACLCHART